LCELTGSLQSKVPSNGKKLTARPRVQKKTIDRDRIKSSEMSAQKKKSSGRGSTPKGDREPRLTPPIPFVPPKVDEGDEPPTVDITIKKTQKRTDQGQYREENLLGY
jgi:hypothetical protein